MARFVALVPVLFVLLLGGCTYKHEPIYNVDRPMPPGAERMSSDRIREIIIAAGDKLEWHMTQTGPGHLEAIQNPPKFSATVDIDYTPARLQIHLKSSVNLLQTDTTIHAHYNFWIRNLESEIVSSLTAAQPLVSAR